MISRQIRSIVVVLALVWSSWQTLPVSAQDDRGPGAVYAMTNAVDGNEIVMYDRAADGMLTFVGPVSTGGQGGIAVDGMGDALGSQRPLLLSQDKRWLFAVNAGSNDISVFRVENDFSLTWVAMASSGGDFPVSLTQHRDLLYVLNSGGDGNITGFTFDNASGQLTPLDRSTRSLDAGGSNPPSFLESPAQVGFTPRGDKLVVTVKGSHMIHVFAVDATGLPSDAPVSKMSSGFTPFGFAFNHQGHLLVAEGFGTAGAPPPPPTPESGAVSSYAITPKDSLITPKDSLQVISRSVGNSQTATCWLSTDITGRYAYATNNLSDTITGYRVGNDGSLTLLDADGVTAETGAAPVDLTIAGGGRFLYNVNAFDGTVSMFRINKSDGSLTPLGAIGGLPDNGFAVGIAAR